MRTRSGLALVALILFAVLAPAPPARAFLSNTTIASGDSSFSFEVLDDPQWTLTTPDGDVYRGQSVDAAKFRGAFGMTFRDESVITLNGDAVEVKLKGKLDGDCSYSLIKLKDRTNVRTITIEFPGDMVSLTCSAF